MKAYHIPQDSQLALEDNLRLIKQPARVCHHPHKKDQQIVLCLPPFTLRRSKDNWHNIHICTIPLSCSFQRKLQKHSLQVHYILQEERFELKPLWRFISIPPQTPTHNPNWNPAALLPRVSLHLVSLPSLCSMSQLFFSSICIPNFATIHL